MEHSAHFHALSPNFAHDTVNQERHIRAANLQYVPSEGLALRPFGVDEANILRVGPLVRGPAPKPIGERS